MWIELVFFAIKTLIITFSILFVVGGVAILLMQNPRRKSGLKVENLNEHYHDLAFSLDQFLRPKRSAKKRAAQVRKQMVKDLKNETLHRIFVMDFNGDVKADAVESLREEISAVLTVADSNDTVFLRLESPGGIVNGYGLAAAQLERLRQSQIKLVVAIDKVAASGGYMMACVASEILCAPFAIVGSIGVLAPVPNVHRLLKKFDIDYTEFTAGAYKRTVSVLGENTPEGIQKFRSQLEATHMLFKQYVGKFRPQLNVDEVATGEYWYGHQALPLKLVDDLKTSDQWLLEHRASHQLVHIAFMRKQKWQEKLSDVLSTGIVSGIRRAINQLQSNNIH